MRALLRTPLTAAAVALLLHQAAAQEPTDVSFSIDYQGQSNGVVPPNGPPITAGDILSPWSGMPQLANPQLPPPFQRVTGGQLGLVNYGLCVGSGPGVPCGVELDALSYGLDHPLPSAPGAAYRILFSVDEWVTGNGNIGLGGPSVTTEGGQVGDASADVFTSVDLQTAPLGNQDGPNLAIIDGDGDFSAVGSRYPGLGVLEPNLPAPGLPDMGDTIDALDIGLPADPATDAIYFSLDSLFGDTREGVPGSGTAQFQGFVGADVLVRIPSGSVIPYALAPQLGLDSNGPETDDLDVLILAENGVPGWQPSLTPFDWLAGPSPGTPKDMLLFSVRRGSAVIGMQDSLQDLPIEPGDLLIPPVEGGNGNPGILIAAEALGLSTSRSGGESDDMNAGDARGPNPWRDCNHNGVEDSKDIGAGTSADVNMNGIPDECEPVGTLGCTCGSSSPCGNADSSAGCANSSGAGALMSGTGTSSWGADDLVLASTGLTPNMFALTFTGPAFGSGTPMGDGLRCVGGSLLRFQVQATGGSGTTSIGPGIVDYSCNTFGPNGCIDIGETWHYQTWYRDPGGPCGSTSNVTNSWSVTFTQ